MKKLNHSSQKETNNENVPEKIELFIQQNENTTIPALVFEYLSKDNIDFENNDLKNFYEQFGEVEIHELNGKISVVLFKLFFSANSCKEFLQNEHNFKDNMKKDFIVQWFDLEKNRNLISEETQKKFEEISKKNSVNIKQNTLNPFINNNNIILNMNNQFILNNNKNIQNQFIQQNILNKKEINPQINLINKNNPLIMQNLYFNGMINKNILNNSYNQNTNYKNNNNIYEEKYNNGKLTCKYEILIPNDKDFQIARRLIGSKGCHMKKIIDECKLIEKNNNNNDIIKNIPAIQIEDVGNFVSDNKNNIAQTKDLINTKLIKEKNKVEMNKEELHKIHNKIKRNIRNRIHQKNLSKKLNKLTQEYGSKFEAKIKMKADKQKLKNNNNNKNEFKSSKFFGKISDLQQNKQINNNNNLNENNKNFKKYKL